MQASNRCTVLTTRVNKIATKSKTLMAGGKGSHWHSKSPTIINLCVTSHYEIFVNFIFKHSLLAFTQSVDNLFHSFIVHCEDEYFLKSSLHCSLSNATPYTIAFLLPLRVKNTFINIFITIQYRKNYYFILK